MFSKVEISDGLGFGGRPWTLCGTSVYTIHLGPTGFASAIGTPHMQQILVHELTHVWQGQNGQFGFGFMVGSCLSQAAAIVTNLDTGAAYRYTPGQEWDDYNCEQQASIVEDWFARGRSSFDPCYRYIRDNIRPGKTGAAGIPQNAGAAVQIDGPRRLAKGQSATYRVRVAGLPPGGRYQWWPDVGQELNGLKGIRRGYDELDVRAEKSGGKAVITVRYTHGNGDHVGRLEVMLT
jgi:hypothetical protein